MENKVFRRTSSAQKMVFNGNTHYVTVAKDIWDKIVASQKLTIEFNLKFNAEPAIGNVMGVLGNYNSLGNNKAISSVWEKRSGANKFCFHFQTNTNGYYETTNGFSVETGVNYRVAFVFYGDSFALYKDGVRQQLVSTSGSLVAINELFRIGFMGNFVPPTYNTQYLDGELFETAIHNKARYSGTTYDHNQRIIQDENTLLYFKPLKRTFDQTVFNSGSLVDALGNPIHGTLIGSNKDFYQKR